MSQAGGNSSGGGGGGGLTTVINNSGSTTVTAGQISILGDDTTANNANGITTTGSTSVTTVLLTNRLQGTGTSTAGVTNNLITFTLSTNTVYRFEIMVAGRSTAGAFVGQGLGYQIFASAQRIAGGASIVETPFIDSDVDITGSTVQFVASGNDVILQVTGPATDTVNYSAVGHFVQV